MSASSRRSKPSRSASVFPGNAGGYHDLKIDSYSRIKGIHAGVPINSTPFYVGGHRWRISFFPNGDGNIIPAGCVSLFLFLDEDVANPLTAQFEFAFMREAEERASFFRNRRKKTVEKLIYFPVVVTTFGSRTGSRSPELLYRYTLDKYVSDMQHGSFTVRCNIAVFDEPVTPATLLSVPPPDLHRHLGDLLQTEKGADVVFQVGGDTFAAHRCVLAARSPVFSAELFGAMKESRTQADVVVQVDDMEAPVFKALLCFLYTDSLPEMRKEDEDVMYQHLLVAGDRYGVERLKVMCEDKLCEYIDVGNAATILTLAEQHHCHGLKKACFRFLSDQANLKAAMASDGFKHLSRSCPSINKDLMSMLE